MCSDDYKKKPAVQNIPIRTKLGRQIRDAICPPREALMSADYERLEMLVWAVLMAKKEK